MREIPLTKGYVAKVDDADYGWLMQWSWYASVRSGNVYAQRSTTIKGRRVCILMHRVILGDQPGLMADHIDHDGLNNQRSNLRYGTRSQNNANRRKLPRKSGVKWMSQYKGVFKNRYRFFAMISTGGVHEYLGTFNDEAEAARAYDRRAAEVFGEFALTNFPA